MNYESVPGWFYGCKYIVLSMSLLDTPNRRLYRRYAYLPQSISECWEEDLWRRAAQKAVIGQIRWWMHEFILTEL